MKKFYLLLLAIYLINWSVYGQQASLIGSYNFDNGAATDESGNSNDLVFRNIDVTNDLLGTADGGIASDGTLNSRAEFPSNFINRSEISISLFFKTNDSGTLLGIQDRPDYQNSVFNTPIIYVGTDGSLRAGFWQGSVAATNVVTASTSVNDNEWHHVVLIAKSGSEGFQKVYLDNQLVGESTSGFQEQALPNAQLGGGKAQNWPVSAGNVTSFPIAASFDQVKIYDGIIDEATIENLFSNAICVEIETNITPSTSLAGNGAISVNVIEGTGPFTYLWSNGATSSTINNLTAGNYSVTITDSEACSQVFNVVVPDTDVSELANSVANTTGQINMVYKESSDETFFVYKDDVSGLLTVKKINSDLSISSLGNVDAVRSGNNPDININPVTGEPWVSFVDVNTVAVYKYDSNTTTWTKDTPGGNWNGYGVNTDKSIIQFDPAGNVYVAHLNSQLSEPGTVSIATNRTGSWASQSFTNVRAKIFDFQYPSFNRIFVDRSFTLNFSDANLDLLYCDFDESTGVWSAPIAFASASFRTDQGLTFSNDGKYAVVINTETNQFFIRSSSNEIAKPINAPNASSANYRQAKMIKSEFDGFHYLLFLNTNNELVLEQYNELNNTWRAIATIDLMDGTNPFFSYDINSSSGDFNVIYSVMRAGSRESSFTVIKKVPEPSILFVDKNAGTGGDGSSWSTAFIELRDALNAVSPATEEIWVAQGTYKPTASNDFNASFTISKDNLKIYGGFAGTESVLAERNLNANSTILSGDLAGNDPAEINVSSTAVQSYSDNSYNVIKIEADNVEVDGFTITGGTAVRPTPFDISRGCAINATGDFTSVKLKNLTIEKNVAYASGLISLTSTGINDISFDLENVIIRNNTSVEYAAFFIEISGNRNAELNINNLLMVENDLRRNFSTFKRVGSFIGGYIRASDGTSMEVNIINSTFARNTEERTESTTGFQDRFFWISSATGSTDLTNVHNSIFIENQSVDNLTSPTTFNNLQTFFGGMGDLVFTHNISLENSTTLNAVTSSATVSDLLSPTGTIFAGPNDYKLSASSIARDAGDNSKVPATLTTDLAGVVRILDGTVDLGAYEFRVPNFTAPTVLTQDITVFLDANGNATISTEDVDNGSSDDDTPVANLNFSLDINSFTCDDLGQNTVTLSVADFDNNIGTATAIVTVEDNIAPAIAVQDISLSLDVNGNLSITGEEFDNGSIDNCSLNWSVDLVTFDCSNLGDNTVEVTLTDDAGNNSSQSVTLTIVDNVAPTIEALPLSLELNNSGTATLTAAQLDNGSADNCGGLVTLSINKEEFTCADLGETEVILTVTDEAGNEASETVIVTVLDNEAPRAEFQQSITVSLDENGTVTVLPAQVLGGPAVDNCGIDSESLSISTFTCENLGENTVEYLAQDASGNELRVDVIIEVIDDLAPEVITQNITVELDQTGNASITAEEIDNGSTDNCSIASLSLDITDFTIADLGENTVTLTAVDAEGNSSSATAVVLIEEGKEDQTITFTTIPDKTYGDAPFPLSVTSTSGLVVSVEIVSGPASIQEGQVIIQGTGNVTIEASQEGNADFNPAESVSQTFNISKKGLTISPEDKIITYGDNLPELTATISGLVYDDNESILEGKFSLSTTATSGSDAGEYIITAAPSSSSTISEVDPINNYQLIFETGTLTIDKKDLTISPENKIITYGDNLPELTATISGLVYDDNESILEGKFSLSTTATSGSDAGEYVITAAPSSSSTISEVDPINNYQLVFESGTLTIEKANQQIDFIAITDKLISDDDFEIEAEASSGLDLTFAIEGPASLSGKTVSLSGEAGTVRITASQAGDINYNAADPISVSFEVIDPCIGFSDESIGLTADIASSNSINGNGSIRLSANENVTYEWSNGATGNILENLMVGTYSVTVTNELGCSFEISFSVGGVTSTKNIAEKELSIFPNPATNFIQIENTEEGESFILMNMAGVILMEKTATKEGLTLNISDFGEGAYLLVAKRKNRHYRIIKKR